MSSKSMSGMLVANHSSIGFFSKRFSAFSRNFVIHSGSSFWPEMSPHDGLVEALLGRVRRSRRCCRTSRACTSRGSIPETAMPNSLLGLPTRACGDFHYAHSNNPRGDPQPRRPGPAAPGLRLLLGLLHLGAGVLDQALVFAEVPRLQRPSGRCRGRWRPGEEVTCWSRRRAGCRGRRRGRSLAVAHRTVVAGGVVVVRYRGRPAPGATRRRAGRHVALRDRGLLAQHRVETVLDRRARRTRRSPVRTRPTNWNCG